MRIGVNTRLLIEGKMDGIGWFAHESLRRLVESHPEDQFIFFFDRKPARSFIFADNVTPVVLFPPARSPILWYIFFQWSLRRALRRYRVDMLLSPDGYVPLQKKVPMLDVIHDLNFEHEDGNLKTSHQRYMTYFFSRYARCATRIATVSQYSKDDIAKTYGITPEKIDVVYNGASDVFHPVDAKTKEEIRDTYADGRPYFLFVSTILRRKNLTNLLKAFDSIRQRHDIRLIVVGKQVWWEGELKEAYDQMQHKESVNLLGRVPLDTLASVMASAEALVYPSYFEGFGIPIVEAFNTDTPVITSNTTSMPEIAGDAALLIDPTDPSDIAKAMETIIMSEPTRRELIDKARERRVCFSWQHTADLLWQSITATINTPSTTN